MNVFICIIQMIAVVIASYCAFRMGKEALISLSVLFAILSNLFVLKQIFLLGWNATGSDAFAIGNLFIMNILQQKYGQNTAKQAIWISFLGLWFFSFFSQLHLLYTPSSYDESQNHFHFLLAHTPRLWMASLITFFMTQQLDVYVYRLFSYLTWKNRMLVSLLISQFFDTCLFSFLGLFGLVSEIGSIILMSYWIKCVIIFFTIISTRFVFYEI